MIAAALTLRVGRSALSGVPTSRRALSTLVVGEHDGTTLGEATLAAITAAKALGPIELLLGGEGSKAVAESAGSVAGVGSVSYVQNSELSKGLAEEWAPVIMAAQEAGGHTHVTAAASAFSKSHSHVSLRFSTWPSSPTCWRCTARIHSSTRPTLATPSRPSTPWMRSRSSPSVPPSLTRLSA